MPCSRHERRSLHAVTPPEPTSSILDLAVLYKHSPVCGQFAREIEERTGIRHESPQAIVMRGGEPVWHASHRGVTQEALTRAVASA